MKLCRFQTNDGQARVGAISDARKAWREAHLPPTEVAKLTQSMVAREGWLPPEHRS